MRRRVTGPGMPAATGRPSMLVTGSTPRPALVRKKVISLASPCCACAPAPRPSESIAVAASGDHRFMLFMSVLPLDGRVLSTLMPLQRHIA